MMHTYHRYASGRAVRKCGFFEQKIKLCAVFNPYANRLSVKMALPHSRFVRQHHTANDVIPANFDAVIEDDEDNLMDEYYNDMYFEDDFYGDADATIDSLDELWALNFGSKYFDNNNVFDAEKFEYGDALGLQMHQNEEMDWKAFKCLNCDHHFAANHEEEDNLYD